MAKRITFIHAKVTPSPAPWEWQDENLFQWTVAKAPECIKVVRTVSEDGLEYRKDHYVQDSFDFAAYNEIPARLEERAIRMGYWDTNGISPVFFEIEENVEVP